MWDHLFFNFLGIWILIVRKIELSKNRAFLNIEQMQTHNGKKVLWFISLKPVLFL